MPRRAPHHLRWSPQTEAYELSTGENPASHKVMPGSPAWFAWLEHIPSFSFQSRSGAHCTVRKETVQRSGDYWYAYRSLHRRTMKRYIGRTADLSTARLEAVAESFTETSDQRHTQTIPVDIPVAASHPSHVPLLESRLSPPRLPLDLVARPQLFSRLNDWHAYKLTLLSAPAGYGKTTLVNFWLAQEHSSMNVAWVSLHASDNDPVRFWQCVFAACQRWYPPLEQHMLNLLLPSTQTILQPPSLEAEVTSFLNKAARETKHRLLVLDDYHVISEPRVHETLSFLLAHLPVTLHVVLMTRSDPSLALGRLRANGELNEFHAADLRFSYTETAAFLEHIPEFQLTEEVLKRLSTQIEGWPAGLRLLIHTLQGKTTQSQIEQTLEGFRGHQRPIREYFVTEVLHAQPAALQDFLLRTSLLDRVHPSLCEAITGRRDSADLLEDIEQGNLFLEPLDAGWYRYQSLFVEAMRHEAHRRLDEGEIRVLLRSASDWFEQHDLLPEAIEAALKTGETARIAMLIDRYVKLLNWHDRHVFYTVRCWLEQIPEVELKQFPSLCLGYAVTLVFDREPQQFGLALKNQVEELLSRAEAAWQADENLAELGEAYAFRAFISYQQGMREQALQLAHQALAWLPQTEARWRVMCLIPLGLEAMHTGQLNEASAILREVRTLWQEVATSQMADNLAFLQGLVYYEQGALHETVQLFRELLARNSDDGNEGLIAIAHLALARVLYEQNDLTMAEQQIEELLQLAESLTAIPPEILQVPVALIQALLQHGRGETAQAIQRLSTLLPLIPHIEGLNLYFYQETLNWLIRLSLLLGDSASAQYWLHEVLQQQAQLALPSSEARLLNAPVDVDAEPSTTEKVVGSQSKDPIPLTFQEQKTLLQVRISLTRGDVEAALTTLHMLLPVAQEAGRGQTAMQIKLLLAQTYAVRKQLPEAREMLLQAVKQGFAGGYQRSFLDEGERIFALLRDLYPHLRGQPLRDYAEMLLQAFARTEINHTTIVTPVITPLYEPLSPQEQRVLRLLAAGCSNAEIANQLVVSVNTIRTQVQSIYRKLQVNNRHAASQRARDLHLL